MKKLIFSVLFIFSTLGPFGRAYSADAIDVDDIRLEGGDAAGLERPTTRRAESTLRDGLSGVTPKEGAAGKNVPKGDGKKLALPLEKADEKFSDGESGL